MVIITDSANPVCNCISIKLVSISPILKGKQGYSFKARSFLLFGFNRTWGHPFCQSFPRWFLFFRWSAPVRWLRFFRPGLLHLCHSIHSRYHRPLCFCFEKKIEKTHCFWERWRGFYEFHSLCPGLLLATRSARKLSLVTYCYKDKLYNWRCRLRSSSQSIPFILIMAHEKCVRR